MEFDVISWVGVVIATVVFFGIGGVYYGPLFGKTWMEAAGMTEEQAGESNLPLIFTGTLLLEFLAAIGLAAILGADASVGEGAWLGSLVAVLLVIPSIAVLALYERSKPTLVALNAGYNLIGFVAMGAIIGWAQ